MLGTLLVAVLFVLALAAAVATAAHAMMFKRDPRSAIAWVIVSFTLPFVGAIIYLVFGVNRIHRQARKLEWPKPALEGADQTHGRGPVDAVSLADVGLGELTGLFAYSNRVTQGPLLHGNKFETLHNGDAAYPAMWEAIQSAEKSVTLCSYIFDSDEVGRQFVDALAAANRRGVTVRVLIDAVGERASDPRISTLLHRAGVRSARFLPARPPWIGSHINLRNHRKILVVDGRVGFTGGMNISARHLTSRTENPHRVTDIHFRVTGPIVADLQEAVLTDWAFVTGEELGSDRFFPPLEETGAALARAVADGPDDEFDRLKWLILGALACSRRRVSIMTPYLIPDRAMMAALGTAALRGVEVRCVLPAVVDQPFVQWATMAFLWELLERGIQIFHRPPPFAHTKLVLVDGAWALIGSANIDPRSLRLNFEFNVEIYDRDHAGELERFFDETVSGSREVTLEQVDRRSVPIRLRDGFAKLFSPYL